MLQTPLRGITTAKNKKIKGVSQCYFEKLNALFGFNLILKNSSILDFKLLSLQSQEWSCQFRKVAQCRATLIQKKYYKGFRYLAGLPANGQRTHTNAQTTRKLKKQS